MPSDKEVLPGFVDDLLSLPTRERQADSLRARGLLDAGGLSRLLDVADGLLNDDPGKARRLAELCTGLSEDADAPAAVPRANYIRAGAHSLNGESEEDLRLTRAAYEGYVALGMHLEALRTNVGKMAALLELGRYEEALDAGRVVVDALDGRGDFGLKPRQHESDLLTALVQHNRGRCYEQMGRYGEALEAYAVAEELYRSLGMEAALGQIFDNRGIVLSYLGRGNEALASHEAAAAIFEEAGLTLSHAMSLGNVGETHLWLANYTSGLNAFERARRLLGTSDAHAEEYFLLRNTADAYLALNLYSEALASYREVEELLTDTGMEHDRAQTLWGMGSVLVAGSELEQADEALAEAARLFAAADNVPMLSGVMLERAALQEARGDRESALATARRALDLVSEDAWPVQHVYARLRLADLLLPDATAAEPHLLAAKRLAERLALPQLRYRLNERLGHLRRVQGRGGEARALLEEAIDEIERLRGTVAQDAMRTSFLRDKTAAYEDLLLLHLARDDDEGARMAFTVAERAKSRALVDLLTGVAQREPIGHEDAGLQESIRAMQADLNATYNRMLGTADDGPGAPLQDLHVRAVALEGEISRLRLQAAAFGSQSDPFAVPALSDDVQDRLPADAALLAYHVAEGEIAAFVSVGGRTRVAPRLGRMAETQRLLRKLDIQWERLRAGRGFAGRHITTLERSARKVLAALYDRLVAPLEPLLEAATSPSGAADFVPKLSVVPHGPLHRVPFHALFDGQRYLVERWEVSYAPSATVYALCQERPARERDGAAVFGVEDPLIPAAEAEALAVAEVLGTGANLGLNATVKAVREAASNSGVLHLACHGLFRSDNPMFSALKFSDGWLTAAEASGFEIPGALVTLSACESGRSEVIGGDEILGLTRAFLGAGAATLVVSLWLVQDETTAELMKGWYTRLREGTRLAAALRVAQLELKERHPHPYYWAPFVLIGKR